MRKEVRDGERRKGEWKCREEREEDAITNNCRRIWVLWSGEKK